MIPLASAFFFLMIFPSCGNAAPKQIGPVFPETVFTLPVIDGLKMDWVLAALDKQPGWKGKNTSDMRFTVDAKGDPWFGNGDTRLFMDPVRNLYFRVSEQYGDFVFLDGGDHLVCTDKYLGTPIFDKAHPKTDGGMPLLQLVKLVTLDKKGCRLFAGAGKTLYIVAHNDKTGQDEVSVLASGGGKPPAASKILGAAGHITALAGDGKRTFFGIGNWVMELPADRAKPIPYFNARKPVTGLAYSEKTGLFYATASYAGFASPKFQIKFITSPNPQIALRGDSLYVRLNRTMGVVRISGAARFRKLRWNEKKPANNAGAAD